MPRSKVPTKYIELIKEFPIRMITSEKEFVRAEKVLGRLLDIEEPTNDQRDYMAVLGLAMEAYSEETDPMDTRLAPHEMLEEAIRARGVSLRDVATATGIAASTLSELINQKREFTRAHVEQLCAYFKPGPDAFIQVPELVGGGDDR